VDQDNHLIPSCFIRPSSSFTRYSFRFFWICFSRLSRSFSPIF